MSSHRAGLSPETVMDRASAEEDDVIKKRINRGGRASTSPFLARTPCHHVIARRYDSCD